MEKSVRTASYIKQFSQNSRFMKNLSQRSWLYGKLQSEQPVVQKTSLKAAGSKKNFSQNSRL
jgi:hypothetical protein